MVFSMIMRKEGAKQNPNDSVKEVGVGKADNSLRKRAIGGFCYAGRLCEALEI